MKDGSAKELRLQVENCITDPGKMQTIKFANLGIIPQEKFTRTFISTNSLRRFNDHGNIKKYNSDLLSLQEEESTGGTAGSLSIGIENLSIKEDLETINSILLMSM